LNCYGGVIFSQKVLLALVDKGLAREEAYRVVQNCAHQAWNTEGGDFQALAAQDPTVTATLTESELQACFDPQNHLHNLEQIYQRLDI